MSSTSPSAEAVTLTAGDEKGVAPQSDTTSAKIGLVLPEEQRFKTRYNFTTLITIYVTTSAGWETIVASLYQVLLAGGPTVLFWSYMLAAVGATCLAASLAELSSIWPTAAAQYHWAVALVPKRWRRVVGWYLSYILAFLQILASVSGCYAGAMQIQSMIIISQPTHVAQRWHVYLIFMCFDAMSVIINIFFPRVIHQISIIGFVLHVVGFFAIIITLLATTKHWNPASMVFTTIYDYSGWNNNGVAFLIGMLPGAYGFVGIDTPAHYAEETAKPRLDTPRAMVYGTMISALIGLPLVLVLGFCIGDPDELLSSPIVAINPLAQILLNSTGSLPGTIVLCSIIVMVAVTSACDGFGSMARVVMSLGRDDALPYGSVLAKLHPRFNTPVNAILFALALQVAVAAIYVGNITAYYGISSGYVVLQMVSLLTPIILHLIFRRKLGVTYGPWHMHPSYRWMVNIFGLAVYLLFFGAMVLPTTIPVTVANMNYASLLLGGTVLIASFIYLFWGRRAYVGPLFAWEENSSSRDRVTRNGIEACM